MTLKELLKPPYYDKGTRGTVYDASDEEVLRVKNGIIKHEDIFVVQDFNAFVIDALNEKYERDFGEPKRWKAMDTEVGIA